jgi:dinuclear metal center YbgI/SA1388 family protein
MSITREQLEQFLTHHLNAKGYPDYGPNGLQVEGSKEIESVAFSVSCTLESIQQATKLKACALVVHHGLFWKFHPSRTITGSFGKRIKELIKNDINLLGYHLPLDAHLDDGNAAGIASLLGFSTKVPFGDFKGSPTGVKIELQSEISANDLQRKLEGVLNHSVLVSCPDNNAMINSIGIVTGGANSGHYDAYKDNLDAYITGEMSEHDWHEAKENGVHMFAGGHHATEVFGVRSLQKLVEKKFQLKTHFIDSDNPA